MPSTHPPHTSQTAPRIIKIQTPNQSPPKPEVNPTCGHTTTCVIVIHTIATPVLATAGGPGEANKPPSDHFGATTQDYTRPMPPGRHKSRVSCAAANLIGHAIGWHRGIGFRLQRLPCDHHHIKHTAIRNTPPPPISSPALNSLNSGHRLPATIHNAPTLATHPGPTRFSPPTQQPTPHPSGNIPHPQGNRPNPRNSEKNHRNCNIRCLTGGEEAESGTGLRLLLSSLASRSLLPRLRFALLLMPALCRSALAIRMSADEPEWFLRFGLAALCRKRWCLTLRRRTGPWPRPAFIEPQPLRKSSASAPEPLTASSRPAAATPSRPPRPRLLLAITTPSPASIAPATTRASVEVRKPMQLGLVGLV